MRQVDDMGIDISSYDNVIVAFSGGKDSMSCVLHLLDIGRMKKVELWHHDVDGQEGSSLMDWPVTRAYCKAAADAFNLPIYFSWKEGGFEREMSRDNQPTAKTFFETPDGLSCCGGKGKPGTRCKFPQVAADLKVRWCSAYLKIDICAAAIRNQERFHTGRTLIITGERAQESPTRSKYKEFETHRSASKKRHVDHWRPVLHWDEGQVWEIIERYKINPHPAYKLGWGRVSCAGCIFGSAHQWASLRVANEVQFNKIADYETKWGMTIQRKKSVTELADEGSAYDMSPSHKHEATSISYNGEIILDTWEQPAGAYGESCGSP